MSFQSLHHFIKDKSWERNPSFTHSVLCTCFKDPMGNLLVIFLSIGFSIISTLYFKIFSERIRFSSFFLSFFLIFCPSCLYFDCSTIRIPVYIVLIVIYIYLILFFIVDLFMFWINVRLTSVIYIPMSFPLSFFTFLRL